MSETTYDVVALGELLVDFAHISSDSSGYPTLKASPEVHRQIFLQLYKNTAAKQLLLVK